MPINRRQFLSLTSVALTSTLLSCAVWSNKTAGILAPLAAAKATVDSKKSFAKAVKNAKPGDTIVIANGRYHDWSVELDCQGTAKQPVTIRPQSAGGVLFTEASHISITGSYVTVIGLHFDKCNMKQNLLEFKRSSHCHINNCLFENSGHAGGAKAAVGISPGAQNNHITDCQFSNIGARCVNLTMNDDIYQHGIPTGNVIRHNHFKDIPAFGENGRETVKIGTKQPKYGNVVVGAIVEENVFDRCNGEAEIISNKCAGNTYRRNIFNQCDGELVMRGGENCIVEGNQFFGGKGGIRLCGKGHVVKDNLIVNSKNTGIRLYYGITKEQGGHYQAATQCLIANNTIVNAEKVGILIGVGRGNDHGKKGIQNVAPEANRIINNIVTGTKGDLCKVDHAPDNLIAGNLYFAQAKAKVSFPGDDPMFADPLFRDAKKGDYRLSKASPALKSKPAKGAANAH